MTPTIRFPILLSSVVLLAFALAPTADAAKAKRYGIEGKLVGYDQSNETMTVKVGKTKVSGSFGSAGVAGAKAPKSIKRGAEVVFAVVSEGSVLKRTVFKAQSGGGLDTTGTQAGFRKAFEMVPKDRDVVISFEENKNPKDGAPEFQIMLVQIRLTEEEMMKRFEESTEEVE